MDGHGNFGSLDGDAAAAYRYTEARLAPLSTDLLSEIKQGTVDFRPNYDGTTEEPIVLPAKIPQLLVNGSTGIAVGMATNIPPHNLAEVCDATVALIDDRDLQTKDLLKYIKGPDFPTGGQVTNSKKELREIYETGQGGIRVRGEWKTEAGGKGADKIIVTSIPYALTKSSVVERIADVIINKKLPMLADVRDESTDDVRVVLELKPGADPAMVMSYLYKHTPLEQSFHVNLTCLVPTENREVAAPARLDLAAMLREFIDFREATVRRRFEFELAELRRRIHILEGFAIIFDLLDEAIRIIRKSEGKSDAAGKLMKRFELSDVQTDAILELKLYKLARLEIEAILEELHDKQAKAKDIEAILADKRKLMRVVRTEIAEVAGRFPDKRRTKIGGGGGDDVEFVAEDFIVDEEVTVILSRDGWLKRVREVKDLSATRLREGDAVLAGRAWLHEGGGRHLLELRQRLRHPHQRRPRLERLRRAGAEALQLPRRRAGGGGDGHERGRRAQGGAVGRGQQERLRPPLQSRCPPRGLDPRRPPVCEARRGRRDRRRGDRGGQRRALRGDQRRARSALPRRRSARAGESRQRRHGHQGRRRRDRGRLRFGHQARKGCHHRRDRGRQRAAGGARPVCVTARGGKGHTLKRKTRIVAHASLFRPHRRLC